MIQIYGRRNSLNVQKVLWTLDELALPFERHDVAGSFGFPAGYEQLNPNQVVPTLIDGDLTLWESNACVRYLAQRYGAGTLAPADPAARARADQWMEWQRGDIEAAFFGVFLPMIRMPFDPAQQPGIDRAVGRLNRCFELLDAQLAGQPHVAGPDFSMGDVPLGAMAYRYFELQIERPVLPNVARWYGALRQRDAYVRRVMIEFGRNLEEWLALEKAGAGL
jgi:glutathione S-transferase